MGKAAVGLVMLVSSAPARADSVIFDPGIGTRIPEQGIDSHVRTITYSQPGPPDASEMALLGGLPPLLSSRVTISGIAWSGYPLVYRDATGAVQIPTLLDQTLQLPYSYTIDGTLLWPAGDSEAGRCLVIAAHGGGTAMRTAALNEKRRPGTSPPQPTSTVSRDAGTLNNGETSVVARAALLNGCAFFTAGRFLRRDGSPIGRFVDKNGKTLVAVDEGMLQAVIASVGYAPWGLALGDPVPLSLDMRAPVWRDVARSAKLLHATLFGPTLRVTIGYGHSAGGWLWTRMISGVDESLGIPTGGNHTIAYHPKSGLIIDYLIARGVTDFMGRVHPDPRFAFAVRGLTLDYGTADAEDHPSTRVRYGQHWPYLADLAAAGVDIASVCRVYEHRGVAHSWGSDERFAAPTISQAGPYAPFLTAWIRNAKRRLLDGVPEPESRFAGFLDAEQRLRFVQEGGTTDVIGFLDDATVDTRGTFVLAPFGFGVTSAKADSLFGGALVDAWPTVDALLPHGPPLRPPILAHRLGGYHVKSFFLTLVPFAVADRAARWPTFAEWRAAVSASVAELEAGGYYDTRAESADTTAARMRSLFSYDPDAAGP
jgi:hypothetical protein